MLTVGGIPAHPLVVHAVVVLLPLAAAGTLLVVARPLWRQQLGIWVLLRSRLGLDAAAVRDDEAAATALGVGADLARRIPYVVSAAGFGAAGAVLLLANLRVEPASIFNVNYSANAFFMALIGGVGTLEGPVVGAIVFFGLQFFLADLGSWYLVLLGTLAIVVMLVAPEGLWGRFSRRTGIVAFPVGYRTRDEDAPR